VDEKLKNSVSVEFQCFSKDFYVIGIKHLTQRWKKYVDNGDFVKK
jgi:hypothetical protein